MDSKEILCIILIAVLSYLMGSCNFAIIISSAAKKDDVRNHGSGNAGMTNMLRTYGKLPAILTATGDGLKGFFAVCIARILFKYLGLNFIDPGYIAGIFVLIGHIFPIFFGFKGGKGVMTSFGALLAINPPVLIAAAAIAVPLVFITKIVSVGSITGAAIFPIFTFIFKKVKAEPYIFDVICATIIGVIVLLVHKDNIKRLINGTENRFGQKKKEEL